MRFSLYFNLMFASTLRRLKRRPKALILVLLILGLSTTRLQADLISLIRADQCETIIEVYVEENKLRAVLEIGEEDLNKFFPWLPENLTLDAYTQLSPEDLERFSKEIFSIQADGRLVLAELSSINAAPRTYRSSLYTGKLDTLNTKISKRVLAMELTYKVKSPKNLIFSPPLYEGQKTTRANIGFIAYHNRLPVNDLRYLSQREKLSLNWDDPWYSEFENINLRRHHQNSMMSFLYMESFEVRHEILVRIKDLDPWLDLGYQTNDQIKKEDLDRILDSVSSFLIRHNPVVIDGKALQANLDKARYVQVSLAGIQVLETAQDLDYNSAIAGIIFSYPVQGLPKSVKMNWELWSENIQSVPCLMTDPAGPMPYDISTTDPVLVWTNHLKNYKDPTVDLTPVEPVMLKLPYLSLIIGALLVFIFLRDRKIGRKRWWTYGALFVLALLLFVVHVDLRLPLKKRAGLSQRSAYPLVSSLLENTYRAFDYKDRETVYDKLSQSADGEVLNQIYLDHLNSMTIERAAGARASIQQMELSSVEVLAEEEDFIPVRARWTASGTVGHWGHQHLRTNQYEAILGLRAIDDFWKIVSVELIEEERVYP